MVGYNESEHQLSKFWQGVAGISSGVATRILCQPLDVLKIRFQLQHEPLQRSLQNYYWGIKQASARIVKEESIRALWKGHVPAQVLSGTYGLTQFVSFEILTKIVSKTSHGRHNKTGIHFACGCISGAVATTLTMPFDTVRTRLVGQGEPKVYKGVVHAFRSMIQTEGYLSLYKGLAPNLIQIVPQTGMQFAFFNFFTDIYSRIIKTDGTPSPSLEGTLKLPIMANLVCGSAAGLCAKTVVYPLDLAKKRLQIQGFEIARKKFGRIRIYNGMVDCVHSTLKEEGISGLYKGLLPSCLKAMATSGLIFALYEEISHIFKSLKL